jgi:hypothetical protein
MLRCGALCVVESDQAISVVSHSGVRNQGACAGVLRETRLPFNRGSVAVQARASS